MIAILSTDPLLSHMLSLEVSRSGLSVCEPTEAALWLLDLDRTPRSLPKVTHCYKIGFSATKESDSRADTVLPLPYSTQKLQDILRQFRAGSPIDGIGHLPRAALVNGEKIRLSPAEERIFEALLAANGETVPTKRLQEALADGSTDSNVLQVHISRLRRKLTADGVSRIRAIRGVGYRLI